MFTLKVSYLSLSIVMWYICRIAHPYNKYSPISLLSLKTERSHKECKALDAFISPH